MAQIQVLYAHRQTDRQKNIPVRQDRPFLESEALWDEAFVEYESQLRPENKNKNNRD